MRRVLAALGSVLLAACATGLPLEETAVVSGGRFNAVQGEADLIVRTQVIDASGKRREVGGAVCTVTTSLYTTDLVTPARLVTPNFGPQSPALNFACSAKDLSGAARLGIRTYWRGNPGYYGYPGFAWGGWGGWGWNGPSFPVFEYPNVTVTLQ